jgi:hypothetical protein
VDVVEGLRQVVERAAADAAHGALDAGVARDHDHLHLGPLALDALQQIEAARVPQQ